MYTMAKMIRMMILVPATTKAWLDSRRQYGYTASGYIRALIEAAKKGKR